MTRASYMAWGTVLAFIASTMLAVCFPFAPSETASSSSGCACSNSDCSAGPVCQRSRCDGCNCVVDNVDAGTLVDSEADAGASGDCVVQQCDGDGGVMSVPVPSGDACVMGVGQCDGHGHCLLSDSAVCTTGSDCFHDNCVDGVCCDSACSGECQACNVPGYPGTCTPLSMGLGCGTNEACDGAGSCVTLDTGVGPAGAACQVGSDCTAGTLCSAGACRLPNGQPCSEDAECGSLHCDPQSQMCTKCPSCTAPSGSPCDANDSSLPQCATGACSTTWSLCVDGTACDGGSDCDCVSGPSGSFCLLPEGAYCDPSVVPTYCASGMSCKGFPPTCLP
jgi:hypothetical protein